LLLKGKSLSWIEEHQVHSFPYSNSEVVFLQWDGYAATDLTTCIPINLQQIAGTSLVNPVGQKKFESVCELG